MCGRFILLTDLSVLAESFGIQEIVTGYQPAVNISPGQHIAAVVNHDKKRLVALRWGLIPAWADDPAIGNRMFNARAETVAEKPSFKDAFKKRRCLIPVGWILRVAEMGEGKTAALFLPEIGAPLRPRRTLRNLDFTREGPHPYLYDHHDRCQ